VVNPREAAAPDLASAPPRVIARVRGASPGPTLIVVASLHGNEPAGLIAAGRALETLAAAGNLARGELIVLAGNRRAIAKGVRFVQRDLNRQWSSERVVELRSAAANPAVVLGPEDREQLELAEVIDETLASARGRVFVVDLHTTSADGIPFALLDDHLRHRNFALGFPLPLLLGLTGTLGGTLTDWLSTRGCVAIAVEGGAHGSDRSVAHHEAVFRLALVGAGLVPETSLRDIQEQRSRLASAWHDLPRAIRVHHRHPITYADRFVMEPGFANVQRVAKGTLLAHDVRGEIRATRDEVLVMPLYQKLGDDGFFLAKEIPGAMFQLGAWVGKVWRR